MMVGGMVMVGAIITNKSPVNLSQVTPIARLTGEYEVIVVPGSSKITSLKDLLGAAQGEPGQRVMGRRLRRRHRSHPGRHDRRGVGRRGEQGELHRVRGRRRSAGGDHGRARHRGHQRATASSLPQIKSGKLRALAISSDKRIPGIDIPTLKEQGVDVELANWRGIFAAPGITDAQRKELIDVVAKAVKTASWQETLKRNDWNDLFLAGDAFKTFLDTDIARVDKIIAGIGLKK